MDHFHYRDGVLHAEDVSLAALAADVGTPFYCYSSATLLRHYAVLTDALKGLDATICYAVKANPNRSVLATLATAGSGGDVVSGGEIIRALDAGMKPSSIVFSGVGKQADEMRLALQSGLLQFNVESIPELHALNDVAGAEGSIAPVAIRINPDVDALTHANSYTRKKENKFGIDLADAPAAYELARSLPHIRVQGVSMHIGSQLTSLAPFFSAYGHPRQLVSNLRRQGFAIDVLDIGGGLGIPYETGSDAPPDPAAYAAMVREQLGDLGCRIIVEPGRLIAGNAGVLVSRVIYRKRTAHRTFLILDAGMNDLMRPALYDAYHEIIPVHQPAADAPQEPVDVVGPVCETGDLFATGRPLPALDAGDLVAFRGAGAYGAAMSGTYNSRLLVPEVMVKGTAHAIVRPRPDAAAMLAAEPLARWLA